MKLIREAAEIVVRGVILLAVVWTVGAAIVWPMLLIAERVIQ